MLENADYTVVAGVFVAGVFVCESMNDKSESIEK